LSIWAKDQKVLAVWRQASEGCHNDSRTVSLDTFRNGSSTAERLASARGSSTFSTGHRGTTSFDPQRTDG